jgi:16S rRNA (guanine(1405)-N(7))-methyltransferase
MIERNNPRLTQLVEAVHASRKYRHVSEAFISSIGTRELERGAKLKEAIKATKNKLHQVGAAFLADEMRYTSWLAELRLAAQSGDRGTLRDACARIMLHQSSTRERLPILDQFYTTILANLPPINTLLDVACGLNPLAIPWMPLAAHATYYAYDIYQDMMDFLNACLALFEVEGVAQARDVIQYPPQQKVDVALILKALPCIEQMDKSATLRLLSEINADHLLVSFPAHSLGGRRRGMAVNYETRFRALIADKDWPIKRFEFANELVFLITK